MNERKRSKSWYIRINVSTLRRMKRDVHITQDVREDLHIYVQTYRSPSLWCESVYTAVHTYNCCTRHYKRVRCTVGSPWASRLSSFSAASFFLFLSLSQHASRSKHNSSDSKNRTSVMMLNHDQNYRAHRFVRAFRLGYNRN